jgi:threonine dehydrogenase-like Zn-dependent dehydrogenase
MARPHGTVALMGVCLEPVEVKPIGWLVNELTLRSSLGCSRDDQREALRMLARQELDPQPLLTRRIGIEDVPNALVELASGADEIKVIVEHEHA